MQIRVKTQERPHLGFHSSSMRNVGPLARYGLGELTERAATLRFQKFYNIVYADNQAMTGLPTALRLTGGTIVEDGKYGSRETQPAMERFVNLWTRIGMCSGTSSYDVRRNGPFAARMCLLAAAFTDPEIAELQAAWLEMKGRVDAGGGGGGGGGGGDAGGGGGGGGDSHDVPEADMPVLPAPKSAGVFGLVLFLGDLVVGGIVAAASGGKR